MEKNLPTEWSAEKNIRWKAAVPGTGHASPIVWGDRIFTVSALLDTQDRVLLCFDRRTGNLLWQRTVLKAPLERKHHLNSFASSTPATDGALVYTAFLEKDKMLAAAYDFEGKLVWQTHPGPFSSMHGFCSSPVLHKDLVILNGDHDGDSYLVALSRRTGQIAWKTPRENKTRSYCVPYIANISGKTQMVLSGDKCVASYDPQTGKRHWVIDGPTDQFVASVVYNPGAKMLFVTGGYPELHILGVRPDGVGNVTDTHIAWRANRGVSYVPSPISEGPWFFIVSDAGIASCYEAAGGKLHWQERLSGEHHASLVSAEGNILFLSDQGATTIVPARPQFAPIATNHLGERCFASPAISQGEIFIRGENHLFCITRKVD